MGEIDNYTPIVMNLSWKVLRFTMKNGVVDAINPSVESTKTDVLNIERGILSMIQVRQVENELNVIEVSLFNVKRTPPLFI